MAAWWGETLYWAATIVAGLLVAWVVWSYVFNIGEGYPVIPIISLVVAGAVWLVGWACRNLIAKR